MLKYYISIWVADRNSQRRVIELIVYANNAEQAENKARLFISSDQMIDDWVARIDKIEEVFGG